MPALTSDEIVRQASAVIAQLYPGLRCCPAPKGIRYLHPTEPSTLSVAPDDKGHFRILLEHRGPFAVVVSASAKNLTRLLDVVRDWREGR